MKFKFRPTERQVSDTAAYAVTLNGQPIGNVRRRQKSSWRYDKSGRVRTGFRGHYRYWVAEWEGHEFGQYRRRCDAAERLVAPAESEATQC